MNNNNNCEIIDIEIGETWLFILINLYDTVTVTALKEDIQTDLFLMSDATLQTLAMKSLYRYVAIEN